MKPTWERDGIQLYLGDCLEVLPHLPKVDAVVTDPPYGIVNKFGKQSRLDGSRTLEFSWDHDSINRVVLSAVDRFSVVARSAFVFCGASQVSHIETILSRDFTAKPAVWIKSCPPPAMPGNWWPSGFEFAMYAYKSGAFFNDKSHKRVNVFYTDTYRHGVRAEEKVDHPTQKWLPLMVHIVEAMVPDSGECLDPFMGSGTTGCACVKLGRKFIGIEKEPKYFEIAVKRIERALSEERSSLFPVSKEVQVELFQE